jgi:hypothetical protein
MKAILEFNLDDDFDVKAHKQAVKSQDMAHSLWEISQAIRSKLKYGELTEEEEKVWEEVRTMFYEKLEDNFVYLDELT